MPPLNYQAVPILISGEGIDTGKDPKIHSGLVKAENAIFPREGAIEKRTGIKQSTDTFTTQAPTQLATLGSTPIMYGAGPFARYKPAGDAAIDLTTRKQWQLDVDVKPLRTRQRLHGYADLIYGSDFIALYHIDVTEVGQFDSYITTYDRETRTQLEQEQLMQNQNDIRTGRLVEVDGKIQLYYSGGGFVRTLDITAGGVVGSNSAIASMPTNALTDQIVEACVVNNGGNQFVCVIAVDTANIRAVLRDGGNGGASETALTVDSTGTYEPPVACFPRSDTEVTFVWVEGAGPYDVHAIAYDMTGSITVPDGVVLATSDNVDWMAGINRAREATDEDTVCVSLASTVPSVKEVSILDDGAKYDGGVTATLYRAQLATQIASVGSDDWIFGIYATSFGSAALATQQTFVWYGNGLNGVGGEAPIPVGKSSIGLAGTQGSPCSLRVNPDGGLSAPLRYIVRKESAFDGVSGTHAYAEYALTVSTEPVEALEHRDATYFGGSLPLETDGSEVHEQGFLFFPEDVSSALVSGGSLPDASVYNYKAVYEWTDALGRRHISAPTPTATTQTTASPNLTIRVTIPTLIHTLKSGVKTTDDLVKIAIYRTTAGGTIYYRANTIDSSNSAATVTWNDDGTVADASLTSAEVLPTTGGVLSAIQPRPYRVQTFVNRRQFTVDRENESTRIFYSREILQGEPVLHNDNLLINIPDDDGRITALSHLSDKLVVFKASLIYVVDLSNGGLNDLGIGPNYPDPYLINPAVGCTDYRSVVRVPAGLMFLAADGIWQLGGNFQLQPIGDPVRYLTDTYTISGAVSIEDRHQVIFTTDGPAIVYDWLRNRWSTYANHEGVSAVAISDKLYRLDSSFNIFRDDRTTYGDDAQLIPLTVETGWIPLGQLGAVGRLERIQIIGQNVGSHTFKVRVAYNGDPAWDDSQTFTSSALQTFDYDDYLGDGLDLSTYTDQAYLLEVTPSKPRAKSVRLQITDSATPATGGAWGDGGVWGDGNWGEGGSELSKNFSLTAIVLKVAPKRNLHRVGKSRVVGAA